MIYYRIAVNAPLREPLTYSYDGELSPGQLVQAPLGKRQVSGVVLEKDPEPSTEFKIKPISSLHEETPQLKESYLKWAQWISRYYFHPVGQVAHTGIPSLKKNSQRKSKKRPLIPEVDSVTPPQLTEEQTTVVQAIGFDGGFKTHLVHGVTGSGKTEVYMELIHARLEKGQACIVLVPEISLTPQLVRRFAERFHDQIAVLHSGLTDRERTDQWWSMVDGQKKILIGARSALFCPIPNLGLIVIDEEHEPSFKQEEKLKYHARDTAIMRAHFEDIPIVLGSATPSLETWQNAKSGRYQLHQLKKRVQDRPMPDVEIIELTQERKARKEQGRAEELPFWLSDRLFEELKRILDENQQAGLFLNRRGMAQVVNCQSCGFIFECPNCAISLTLHGKNHLNCHYCGYEQILKDKCPQCSEPDISPLGLGTELIENDLRQLFPEARLARADRDEVTGREDMEELVRDVERGDVDILIGTQMIAKGLDFPKMNLMGLILADVGFHMPDFRATERSFQLLTQVSGRSGRHSETPGKVIIQTYYPEHASIQFAKTVDFEGFASQELPLRESLSYPPFARLASIRLQGIKSHVVEQAARTLAQRGQQLSKTFKAFESIRILGPAPAPLARLRGQYRYFVLIKSHSSPQLNEFCDKLIGDQKWVPSGTRVLIDIDPITMM